MINPIKEDMNVILLELIEETIGVNKINIATKLAIEENKKKEKKINEELIPEEYHEYLDIFSKKKQLDFLNQNHGTIKSKWRKDLNLSHSKTTISHKWNKLNWTNSSRKIWIKDISDDICSTSEYFLIIHGSKNCLLFDLLPLQF